MTQVGFFTNMQDWFNIHNHLIQHIDKLKLKKKKKYHTTDHLKRYRKGI